MNGPSPEMIELFLQEASEHLQFLREYSGILQDPYPLYEDIERLYISAHGVAGTGWNLRLPALQRGGRQAGAYLPVRHERNHQRGGHGPAGGVHLRSDRGAGKRPDHDQRQRRGVGWRILPPSSSAIPSPSRAHRPPRPCAHRTAARARAGSGQLRLRRDGKRCAECSAGKTQDLRKRLRKTHRRTTRRTHHSLPLRRHYLLQRIQSLRPCRRLPPSRRPYSPVHRHRLRLCRKCLLQRRMRRLRRRPRLRPKRR